MDPNCKSLPTEQFNKANSPLYRFHTDPSGTFMRYDAKAIGSGSEAAQSELQDKWHKVRIYRDVSYICLPRY